MISHTNIESRLIEFFESFECRLSLEDVNNAKFLVAHDEYGIALENFWTQLNEFDVILSEEESDRLRQLSKELGMKLRHFE